MLAQTATFKDGLPVFLLESLLSVFFWKPEIPNPPKGGRFKNGGPGAGDMSVEQAILSCFTRAKIQMWTMCFVSPTDMVVSTEQNKWWYQQKAQQILYPKDPGVS